MFSRCLLTLACALLLSAASFAQFKKGDRLIGSTIGTTSYGSGNTDFTSSGRYGSTLHTKNFSVNLSPLAGIFITDNAVIGGSLLFQVSRQKASNSTSGTIYKRDNANVTDAGAGFFFRQYLKGSASLRPFAHIYLNAGSGKVTGNGVYYYNYQTTTATESYDTYTSGRFFINTGINAGVTKMIAPGIGIDAFIGYGFSSTDFKSITDGRVDYASAAIPDETYHRETGQHYSGSSLNLGIGVQVFLKK
jgi:hypothetical protein